MCLFKHMSNSIKLICFNCIKLREAPHMPKLKHMISYVSKKRMGNSNKCCMYAFKCFKVLDSAFYKLKH